MGGGMGLAQAPATESIMGSLPPAKAGVGSAVNDTTRELGGALGVAIVGSIMATLYSNRVHDSIASLPEAARRAANGSVGAAVAVDQQLGGHTGLATSARVAFVHAMSVASLITAAFATLGALVAWRWLPARAQASRSVSPEPSSVEACESPCSPVAEIVPV
jgi:hypothetical protein